MARATALPVGFRFDLKFYYADGGGPFTARDGPDASFQEVSGISVDYEVQTKKDGTNSRFVQKLPGKPVFPNLVLKRGLLLDSALFVWFNGMLDSAQFAVQPLDVEVHLNNESGDTLVNFRFVKAWPKKWEISGFNAMQSSIVIETIELCYQYFTITPQNLTA